MRIRTLRFLLQKEFLQIGRNPMLPRMIIMMPLMTILLMPWAATMEIRNLNVVVVDNDRTMTSERLIEKISASNYFHLTSTVSTYEQALETIESGSSDIIVSIPLYFGRDLENFSRGDVFVAPNAVNGMQGSLAGQYMTATISDFASELSVERFSVAGRLSIEPRYLFNPYLDSKWNMIPALIVMLITMLCGYIPTLNIVSEKEKGTIEQINVSPVGRLDFILAKILPMWVVGFVSLTISMIFSAVIYGLSPAGSLLTIYGASLLFAAGFAGVGLLISSVSSTMQQSMFVMFFFLIVFMLTSGLFTPIRSMPRLAQDCTVINPMRYYIEIMRSVYLKGSSSSQLWFQFSALGVFAAVFNVWSVLAYKKRN